MSQRICPPPPPPQHLPRDRYLTCERSNPPRQAGAQQELDPLAAAAITAALKAPAAPPPRITSPMSASEWPGGGRGRLRVTSSPGGGGQGEGQEEGRGGEGSGTLLGQHLARHEGSNEPWRKLPHLPPSPTCSVLPFARLLMAFWVKRGRTKVRAKAAKLIAERCKTADTGETGGGRVGDQVQACPAVSLLQH